MANTGKPPQWSPMNNDKSIVILPDKLQSAYTQIDSYSKETRNQIVWLYRKLCGPFVPKQLITNSLVDAYPQKF